jgi:hypothetical protein
MGLMPLRRYGALFVVVVSSLLFSSCLARSRAITRPGGRKNVALLVSDRDTLLQEIGRRFSSLHDFSATVDMVPALGSAEKSKITEYKDVRAYILFRQPASIRLIGLYPVVRTQAFDMVSMGPDFKLYIPAQNRFITGPNEVRELSKNRIENLRPQHFLQALMVSPPDPAQDQVVLENFTDEANAFYILHMIRNGGSGLRLNRTVWFDRTSLQLARQMIFDERGNILTDARYSDWSVYDNVPFPKHIEINRPVDEYGVVIDVVKMDINKGLTDDRFVLEQPSGSKLQMIGQPAAAPPEGTGK